MAQTSIIAGGAPTPNMGATSPGGGGAASTLTLPADDSPLNPALPGQAVTIDTPTTESTWSLGKADSANTATVRGLVLAILDPLARAPKVNAQFAGIVKLTVAQWNAVVGGSTGLVPGNTYYLSPSTAGALTSSKPTTPGQLVVPIGQAFSTTELLLAIALPTLLT